MPETRDDRFKDVAILTRAIENVFRKLIRFLAGRISLVKLQEMIGFIYVEESESQLRKANPGKSVPLTQLALSTGLDTRTVAGIRRKILENGHLYRQQFLRELTPETAIVEAWAMRVANAPADRKQAERVLTYGTDESAFEKLFRSTISSRGVTTQSIIERLAATNCIVHHRQDKTIELVVDRYSPYLSDDEQAILNSALSAIANLVSTIEHNLQASGPNRFFQRQIWTFRLEPQKRSAFRALLRQFLEQTEESARSLIEPWESERYEDEFMGLGIGLYYFEERKPSA